MPITVTERAVAHIKQLVAKRERAPQALRVGVKGGGCTGFQYLFEFSDEAPKEHDKVFELDGAAVKLICDPKSYLFLNGTELDYVETLMEAGFKFQNPNVKSTCGCGQSVSF
ncbi:MAG TPA: iron-sulfur cluster assembly accessory protein [Polyangia bacterium]|jgi:iron-sulfur cluster assembly protein